MDASENGHLDVVKELLEKRASVNIKTQYDDSSLRLASENGHLEVVRELLANGATDDLIAAASRGDLGAIKALVASRVDVNAKNDHSWRETRSRSGGRTALMTASRHGHREAVETLLRNQAEVNDRASDGATALMLACEEGHREVVEVRLAHRADIDLKDTDGETALMKSLESSDESLVRFLLENGADASVTALTGMTALIRAAFQLLRRDCASIDR